MLGPFVVNLVRFELFQIVKDLLLFYYIHFGSLRASFGHNWATISRYRAFQAILEQFGLFWVWNRLFWVCYGSFLGRLMPIWVILGQVQTVWNSFRQYGQLGTVSGPFRADVSCFNAFQVVSASVGPFQAVSDRFRAFQAVLSWIGALEAVYGRFGSFQDSFRPFRIILGILSLLTPCPYSPHYMYLWLKKSENMQ